MTVKIKELKVTEQHLVDIKNAELSEIHGSGFIGAGIIGGFTALGIGIQGLATNRPTGDILRDELIFGGTAAGGFFTTPF